MCFGRAPRRRQARRTVIGQNRRAEERREGSRQRAGNTQTQCNIKIQSEPRGAKRRGCADALRSRLAPAENVLALLAVDLDDELRFGDGLLALTDRRLLARSPRANGPNGACRRPALALQLGDHAGHRHARPARRPRAGSRAGATRWRGSPPRCGCTSCSTCARVAGRAGDSRRPADADETRAVDTEPPGAAVDLGAAAPRPLRQALPQAADHRLRADPGLDRRHPGAALPDHPADGRHPDSVPERPADRGRQGGAVPGARCWRRRWSAGRWAGPAPICWRWSRSASAPTCAPPPTSTC